MNFKNWLLLTEDIGKFDNIPPENLLAYMRDNLENGKERSEKLTEFARTATTKDLYDMLILQKKELGNYYEIICYKDLKNSSKQKISGYTQKISSWTEQLKNIIKDLKSLEEQLYYLKTNQANCLVCEQLIAEQQKEFVLDKINNKKIFIENRIKRLANLLENIKKIINQESQNLEIIELKINKNNLEIELNQKRNLIAEQIKKLNLQLKDHDDFAEIKQHVRILKNKFCGQLALLLFCLKWL